MSKLEELIEKLCPNGVEYKTLGELGTFYGGLTGKSKEDFKNGNAKFISYMNVYSNLALDVNMPDKVKVGDNERQNKVQLGDILFTGSSENTEECGMSSVLTVDTDEPLYLNSFCFGYRFNNNSIFIPNFSKFLFRSHSLRKQIIKTASGVTRFNVSKKKMEKVVIPVPPIELQEEIVRILDNFTELTKELTKELKARKKQYEYYRDELLTFNENDKSVEWKTFADIGTIERGNGLSKADFTETGCPGIHYGQIYTYYGTVAYITRSFTSDALAKTLKTVSKGDIIIAVTSENMDDVCKCVAWLGDENIVTGGHTAIFKHNQNPKFIAYWLQTREFYSQKTKLAQGTKVIEVSPKKLEKVRIPLPPLVEQERIVSILDKFDALCNDIKVGLPAEIEARKKQYEYYRDKLLTFKEKVAS